MRYPQNLKKGENIGFPAPSFGVTTEPYNTCFSQMKKVFEKAGYGIKEGINTHVALGIGKSNSAEKCAAELMDMYCSDDTRALISCGGGETMCEDLSYIDFERIKKASPKWFMGYSDNTNFVFPLTTICDVAAVYGPCAPSFGAGTDETVESLDIEKMHKSKRDAIEVITSEKKEFSFEGYGLWEKDSLRDEEHPLEDLNLTEKCEYVLYKGNAAVDKISMKGRLVGGCLDCLITLCGTKFDKVSEFVEKYKDDGIIWFLESCDLNVMGMRRAIWQISEAGWFKYAKGFMIGRPMELHFGEEMMGMNQYNAVMGVLSQYGVPVVMDCDFGHCPPSIPIISGSVADVEATTDKLLVNMKLI